MSRTDATPAGVQPPGTSPAVPSARGSPEPEVAPRLAVFEAVAERLPDGLLVETADRRVLTANRRFLELFDLTEEDASALADKPGGTAGRCARLLTDPEAFVRGVEEILRQGREVRGEELRFADGRILERDYVPLPDESGDLAHHLWLFRCVTERRRSEEALRRSEADYRALFRNAVHGIFRSTVEGELLAANEALTRMLGYESPDEVLALDLAAEIYHGTGERTDLIHTQGDSDRFDDVEATWRRRDGTLLPVRLTGRAIRDEQGEIEGFETFVVDVTKQRTMEQQLRQAQRMEAIGQLTGGIAHDFNNLLSVILGNAELLAADLRDTHEALLTDLREITGAAERAAALTKRLLQFSRQSPLDVKPTDVRAIVSGFFPMLRRLIPQNIGVQVTADELPAMARVDAQSIEQMLLNLIANAQDAMPDGGRLRIDVRRASVAEGDPGSPVWLRPGRYVRMSVADSGTGMDEHTRQRIFEPFFTTKEPGKGTGLGMATVYGLTKQQEGYVLVESAPGRGTSVRLYFPVAEDESA